MPRLWCVFAHGHQVGQHLRRVKLIGQPVVHRYAGKLSQFLDNFLCITPLLDRDIHAAQNARGIIDAFLYAQVRTSRYQVGDMGALVISGHLECATRAG